MPFTVHSMNATCTTISGRTQWTRSRGKPFAFDKAPDNPKNAYVMVPGGHMTAAANGADQIVAWVKGL